MTRLRMKSKRRPLHRGITTVEVAIVAPVTLLLLIGLMVGGMGAFRYQQVANLAREGATYLAVRGPSYARRTGQATPDSSTILNQAILPLATGFSVDSFECESQIDTDANTATVTLKYQWIPEALFVPVTLQSTAVVFLEL